MATTELDQLTQDVGIRVRAARKARGWSMEHLAHRSGFTLQTIGRVERGERFALPTLAKIAQALEISVGELLGAQEAAS